MLAADLKDAPVELTPERLRAANIHPETRLATDYLNHFNEAIMLLELIPSMPDCIDDVIGWAPLSYEQHFLRSGYRDKELVIAAYRLVPGPVLARFQAVIAEMDLLMTTAIAQLNAVGTDGAAVVAEEAAALIKPLAARAAGIMNGTIAVETGEASTASTQDAVDALMTP
jgi:hypothetical protein